VEESKTGIDIEKGIKGAMQDFPASYISTIINELKHCRMLLGEQGQKLEKLTDRIHQLDARQTEILMKLHSEERVIRIEGSRSLSVGPEAEPEPKKEEISRLFSGRTIKIVDRPKRAVQ